MEGGVNYLLAPIVSNVVGRDGSDICFSGLGETWSTKIFWVVKGSFLYCLSSRLRCSISWLFGWTSGIIGFQRLRLVVLYLVV